MPPDLFMQLLARCWGPDPDPWGVNRSRAATRRTVPAAAPPPPTPSRSPLPASTPRHGGWRCTAHCTVSASPSCQCGPKFRFFDPEAFIPVEPHPLPGLTLEAALSEAGVERMPESKPAPPPPSLNGRSRDPHTGRYLPEPISNGHPHPDEALSQSEIYAHVRRDWFQLPNGAKKPYARELGLPVATVRGIAKGRAGLKTRILRTAVPGRSPVIEGGLPEAVRRRVSRVLHEIDRKERVLVRRGGRCR